MSEIQNESRANVTGQTTRGLIHDWQEEIYPHDFINTFKEYFINHRKFFDEVFNENWENKVKPIPFFFASITMVFFAGSISPYDNTFEEHPKWDMLYSSLSLDEKEQFKSAFKLHDVLLIEDANKQYMAGEHRLQELIGINKQINAKHIQEYFERPSSKHSTLAARAEYQVLKSKEENELGDLGFTFMLNFILIYFISFWRISHRFLKCSYRTPRQTIQVYLYNMSMFMIFVYVPLIFLDEQGDMFWIAPTVALLFVLYQGVRVFRYTHNVGFLRLVWASILTTLVIATFLIPLLFMSSKPMLAEEKAQ